MRGAVAGAVQGAWDHVCRGGVRIMFAIGRCQAAVQGAVVFAIGRC